MKKRVLIVLLCLVGVLSSAFAAEKKVQGVVISSEDNLPLIGASVYVTAEDLKKAGSAQTTMGVITDVDGQFSIAIPAGITRFFCSYVGYDVLEVKLVPGKEHYEITLHASSQMLDAVVVTGYQTVERRKLTAAVSKLDISDETIGAVTCRTNCRTFCQPDFRCSGCSGKDTHSRYCFIEWYTRPFVGAGRHSFGGNGCSRTG